MGISLSRYWLLLALVAWPAASQSVLEPVIPSEGFRSAADFSDGGVEGIARGSLFSIFGVRLADTVARANSLPLPTMLNGVRVRIWVDDRGVGPAVEAPLLYVSPTQINAVMPSSIREGTAWIRVHLNGVESSLGSVPVVTRRFASFTQAGYGFGPAVLQQVDDSGRIALNRFLNPARPGQAVVLWGTGLGALLSGSDSEALGPTDLSAGVTVWVAGTPVRPFYAGRAPGLPGVDQINFVLPGSLPERCYVPLVVEAGQVRSKVVTLATGSGGEACPSEFGLSGDTLSRLDGGGMIRAAVLSFESVTSDQARQSVEFWIAGYDAAFLSALARQDLAAAPGERCSKRRYSFSRINPAPLPEAERYGVSRAVGFGPTVQIQGTPGCDWSMSQGVLRSDGVWRSPLNGSTCLASSFSFAVHIAPGRPFLVAGEFPQPRRASAISDFAIDRSGADPRATWLINSKLPGDAVKLTARSSWTLTGNVSFGATQVRELSCEVPVERTGLQLARADYDWAVYLPDHQTRMSLETTSDRLIHSDASGPLESVDFVLIRIRNGVTAVAGVSRPQ